jgi:hypothetical protein
VEIRRKLNWLGRGEESTRRGVVVACEVSDGLEFQIGNFKFQMEAKS